ncbi:hypothetical protein [Rhizobium sullae]|uniref:Uncharacterized protein n=1 Tax=Rhizobium sullae TaxID=50338 RepID=A0A4R3QG21_RHISU|nr:hypothetical protein [Rhizobium sullae]TCU20461.1 hypothetical protein EV132_101528 [Rhizobium sullae]
MADDKSKLGEITPAPDADPLLSSAPSEAPAAVGHLASFAMTAIATVVAVGIDSGMTIPNVSLVFVVPVIIAGVAFGLLSPTISS